MPNELTIRLGGRGDHVTVDLLIETLENTLEILRGLEPKISASGKLLRWEIIRASMKSPLALTLAPEVDGEEHQNGTVERGEKVVRAYLRGMREIESTPTVPQYFDEEIMQAAKRIVQATTKQEAKLTLSAPDEEPVEPTHQAAANIEQAVSTAARTHRDYGTVEGVLEVISTHNGDSFVVWETLTKNRVECHVNPEQLEYAKNLLRKRVAVSGRARYKSGRPVSVEVADIRVLRDVNELPQPIDIGKVDITAGVGSEEHVQRMRDGR